MLAPSATAIKQHCGAEALIGLALHARLGAGWPLYPVSVLARAGDEANVGFKVNPHMLRHACGYALANKGIDTRTLQAYLGHRSINSTTRYAALAPGRFKNIWGRA
jgi:integrase